MKLTKFLVIPFAFLALSFSSGVVLANTSRFAVDHFTSTISDFNHPFSKQDAPYLKISHRPEDQNKGMFEKLYKNFVSETLLTYGLRQYCDNDVIYETTDNANVNLTFHVQSTYSIKTKKDASGGYLIDNGLFSSYYSDDILGPKGYELIRGECDSFIFISDKFADALVKQYHLGDKPDPYAELIKNKDYYVLPIRVDNKTILKFCINNIIYSNKKSAIRCSQFNNNFGLIYLNKNVSSTFDVSFEIDFKSSPACIMSTLEQTNSLGYGKDNYIYGFYTINKSTNNYEFNKDVTDRFLSIKATYDVLCYIGWALILIVGTFGFYMLAKKWKLDDSSPLATLIILISMIFVYSMITSFVYTYPLFSVAPIYFMTVYFILRRKDVGSSARKLVFKEHTLFKR